MTIANILLVEDNNEIAKITVELMTYFGYDMHSVPSAEAAVKELAARSDIDLVFSDIRLGKQTGIWLAGHVVENYPHIPVVLTTGYASAVGNIPIQWPVIQKPYASATLVRVFEDVLAARRRLKP